MDQKLNKMWKYLDDLAANDPAAYRAYIQDMKTQAKTAGRIIQPGYSVDARARNDGFKHTLNICKSNAVEKCSDSFNIPTLMSEQRRLPTKDGSVEYIYDAVFHGSVFDRDDVETSVLDLAASCVEELFRVSLERSSYKITKDSYYGPYGWDDKKGKPLTTEAWEDAIANPEKETLESLKEAKDLLFGKGPEGASATTIDPKNMEILTRPPLESEDDRLPDIRLSKDQSSFTSKTLIEEIDDSPPTNRRPKSGLIEMINESSSPEKPTPLDTTQTNSNPKGKYDRPRLVEPKFTSKMADDRIDVVIMLPDIKSGEEVEYTPLEDSKFQVSAGNRYLLCYSLPKGYDSENANARFILKKQKLKLSFSKAA